MKDFWGEDGKGYADYTRCLRYPLPNEWGWRNGREAVRAEEGKPGSLPVTLLIAIVPSILLFCFTVNSGPSYGNNTHGKSMELPSLSVATAHVSGALFMRLLR